MTPGLSTLRRFRDRLFAQGIDPADADSFFWDELDPERRAAILRDFRIRVNDARFLSGVSPFISARRKTPNRPVRLAPVNRAAQDDADFERGNEALRSVEAAVYLEALVPESEPARGRCRCPWPDHEDRTPSASYSGAVFFCHTCAQGGGVFELGSALTGRSLHGKDFLEVRRFLAERLLGAGV